MRAKAFARHAILAHTDVTLAASASDAGSVAPYSVSKRQRMTESRDITLDRGWIIILRD
ncbi:MAG: hypothetical protein ACI9VR_004815, partial [Cognaticolwellia sp.]